MSFLRELGVEEGRLRKMLAVFPALLSYKVDTMRSKVAYLKEGLRMRDEHVRLRSWSSSRLPYHAPAARCSLVFDAPLA